MAASHQLNLLVNLDNSKAVKGFKEMGKEAGFALGDAALNLDKLQAKVRNFGLAMIAGSAVAGKGLYELAQSASNLNETLNKTKQIFGDVAANKLSHWAEDAATKMGMSTQAALDGAAAFGVFYKSAGQSEDATANLSAQMVQLASDLASFYNTSPEEAITAIGAAFRGESEPIRRYGVLLDEATLKNKALELGIISASSKALTPQQRILAAHAEILAQTGDAQGDYARTSDSMANATRTLSAQVNDLKTSFGQYLTGPMEIVIGMLSSFVELIDSIPEPIKRVIAYLMIAKTVLLGLGGAAAVVVSHFLSTQTAAWALSRAAQKLPGPLGKVAAGMQDVNKAASIARKGVMALATTMVVGELWNEIFDNAGMATKALADFNRATDGTADDVVKAFEKMVNAEDDAFKIKHIFTDIGKELTIVGTESKRNIEDIDDAFKKLFESDPAGAKLLIDSLKEQVNTLDSTSARYKDNVMLIERLEGKYKDWSDASLNLTQQIEIEKQKLVDAEQAKKEWVDEQSAAIEAIAETADALKEESDRVRDLASAFSDAADKVEGYIAATDALITGQLDVESATLSLQSAQEDYINTMLDGEATDRAKAESHNSYLRSVLALKDAVLAQNQAQVEATGAVYDNDQRVKDSIATLEYLKGVYPELATEIQGMIDEYNKVPKQKDVKIHFQGKDQSVRDIKTYIKELDNVSEERKASVLALINQGKYKEAEDELNLLAEERDATITVNAATETAWTALREIESYVNNHPLIWQVNVEQPDWHPPQAPPFSGDGNSLTGGRSTSIDESPNEVTARATKWALARDRAAQQEAAAQALEERRRKRDSEMENKHAVGDLSDARYKKYLESRLDDYEKYSDEWMQIQSGIQDIEEAQADRQEQRKNEKDSLMQNKLEEGAITKRQYERYLKERLKDYEKYSDEWMAIKDQLDGMAEAKDDAAEERARQREERQREHQSQMANRYESGDITKRQYKRYLTERLNDFEKYSDEWMAIQRQLDEMTPDAEEQAATKEARQEERRQAKQQKMANMYQVGDLSPAQYIRFLEAEMAKYEKYSPEWMQLYQAYLGAGGDALSGDPRPGGTSGAPSLPPPRTANSGGTAANPRIVEKNYTINLVGWNRQAALELQKELRKLERE